MRCITPASRVTFSGRSLQPASLGSIQRFYYASRVASWTLDRSITQSSPRPCRSFSTALSGHLQEHRVSPFAKVSQQYSSHRIRSLKNLRPPVRNCSYQRAMCKHQFAADAPISTVDISKGREVLPKNVKPIHYHLTLEPNLKTFEYEGEVAIEYVLPENTTL